MQKNISKQFFLRIFILLMITMLLIIIFRIYPMLDLGFSKVFFDTKTKIFPLDNNLCMIILDKGSKIQLIIFFLAIVWLGFKKLLKLRSLNPKHYRKYIYLTIMIFGGVIGVVDMMIKEHSARPRPYMTTDLGGTMEFKQVLDFSGACAENCSFVSSHAACGFIYMALAFCLCVRNRFNYKYELLGLALGLSFGLVRIMQGRHFLSDILFSGLVMYALALLLAIAVQPYKDSLTNTTKARSKTSK